MARMKSLLILLAAAANPAELLVRASATIVRGERIALAGPASAPGRQSNVIVREDVATRQRVELRLTEFQ